MMSLAKNPNNHTVEVMLPRSIQTYDFRWYNRLLKGKSKRFLGKTVQAGPNSSKWGGFISGPISAWSSRGRGASLAA